MTVRVLFARATGYVSCCCNRKNWPFTLRTLTAIGGSMDALLPDDALWERMRRGVPGAEDELAGRYERHIRAIVRTWHIEGMDFDDCLMVARIAALQAIRSWVPAYGRLGPRISTYVKQALSRERRRAIGCWIAYADDKGPFAVIDKGYILGEVRAMVGAAPLTGTQLEIVSELAATGGSYGEIARRRGTSRQAVHQMMKRVRRKLLAVPA